MKITNHPGHEKSLAVTTVIVLLGAVVFRVIVDPQIKERQVDTQRMHQLQLELVKMNADLLIKDRIGKTYSQIEPLIRANGTDQQEISLFSRELNGLHSGLPLKIQTIKIMPLVFEEHYRKLSIRIEMSGNIRDIAKFIEAVETYPKPIRIEQLELKTKDRADYVQASFLLTKVVSKFTPIRHPKEVG